MNESVFTVSGFIITRGVLFAAAAAIGLLVFLLVLGSARRRAAVRRLAAAEANAQVAELARAQFEMNGRIEAMGKILGSRQAELLQGLSERLDGLGQRIGQSMTDTTRSTHENLSRLYERLAVITEAQKNITTLAGQVGQLQQILANKQTRGAFGQARMEAIVQDGLAAGSYEFQATLSNGTRPDCLIRLPNGASGLVVDAKFPLEAWNAIRAAGTPEATRTAEAQFRRDTLKHVQDIADRYLVPGETQDTAFMFVPSESVFADIHERFEDVVQRALRAHVVIVSPSLLMLSIQVVQSLLRDARMREQAHVIQDEVVKLMDDVRRLDDRVRKLQNHFGAAVGDIEQILTSTRKITSRGAKIEAVELDDAEVKPAVAERETSTPQLPFTAVEEV
jgi:DNA recombination protein RmuC